MEQKNERRFRLLDFALILLALLAALGIWQRNNLKNLFAEDEVLERYVITFEVKCVRSTTASLLEKDVSFYTSNGEERLLLGTLTQPATVSPATVYLPLQNAAGEVTGMVEAVYPQDEYECYQDIGGELACLGIEHEGSFFVAGKMLLVKGQEVAVQTETVDIVITVTGYKKAV